ncbi:MAG: hypothetical protein ACR2HR_16520 [Euzebya sp.]
MDNTRSGGIGSFPGTIVYLQLNADITEARPAGDFLRTVTERVQASGPR